MPKGKNGSESVHTATRCIALKASETSSPEVQALISDVRQQNNFAASIHRVMALCLGLCDDDPERRENELEWLKENSPEFYRNFIRIEGQFSKEELHAAVFLVTQFGTHAKDSFYAFSLPGKKTDSLLRGIENLERTYTGFFKTDKSGNPVLIDGKGVWIKGSIEKSRQEYQDILDKCTEQVHGNPPQDEVTMNLEEELEVIKKGKGFIHQIKNGAKPLPFCWIKNILDSHYKSSQVKLIIEAAFQRLLGYLNTRKAYQKEVFEFSVKEFLLIQTDEKYQEFLSFVKKHGAIVDQICRINPRHLGWREYLKTEILEWSGVENDSIIPEITKEELLHFEGIKEFDRCLKLYLKFRKGPGRPTGLTFIDFESHPFDFTIPGERTLKGGYNVVSLPSKKSPGSIMVRLSDGSMKLIKFNSREINSELVEKSGREGSFPYLYRTTLGRKGNSTSFSAALGGLKICPRKHGLFLDLTVNIVCSKAPDIPWNKKEKHFDVPPGAVLGAVVFGVDGTMFVRKMKLLEDGLKHLATIPVEVSSLQYEKLPAVQVTEDGELRRAWKGEFGRLLGILGHYNQAPEEKLLTLINERIRQQVDEINSRGKRLLPVIKLDMDNLMLLRQHYDLRNDRTGKKEKGILTRQSGSLGRLYELHQGINRLKRELFEISAKIKEIRTGQPENASLKDMQRRKKKIIRDLKEMRKHQLNARDVRVRSFSHRILELILSSEKEFGGASADIVVLPEIKLKDVSRKPGKSQWSKLENTLLNAGRSGEICDIVTELASLFGISTLRVSSYKASLMCPKCRKPGIHYWRKGKEIKFEADKSRNIGEALPMPQQPSFGCPSGCVKELDPRHLMGGEMIHRICFGSPGCKSSYKPGEARKALLKILK